ncbi:uncharacterized protein LOC114162636 [Vigna unguiculata]|uniref:Uncharacterized protein n=1 Tax=Vigna unguiculata TaxID=3917 RepID=A0A4D6NQC7_VIGUN|nr:uncharacterized protein LOC114162636 [Vigna unguiculata]QCE15826.1 hypothetical protein DEO72_LG11g2838 [Vigna unguiculata]
MGNENHQQHQFYYQKSTFLPMLCSRPTIKDVTMPRFRDPSAPSSNDPLSPRISCMGQVKRNNKIAGIPPSHRLSFPNKSSPSVKYSKLRRLFSGKNFIITTPKTTTAAASASAATCRSRQQLSDVPRNQKCLKSENNNNNNNVVSMMSIEEMDPPLPVVKRVLLPKSEEGKELDSLWKRRSGTARPALKSLQLQQIHHPRICHQPPTV